MIELSGVLLLVGVCLTMHFVMHGRRHSSSEPARKARDREGESHDAHREQSSHGCH